MPRTRKSRAFFISIVISPAAHFSLFRASKDAWIKSYKSREQSRRIVTVFPRITYMRIVTFSTKFDLGMRGTLGKIYSRNKNIPKRSRQYSALQGICCGNNVSMRAKSTKTYKCYGLYERYLFIEFISFFLPPSFPCSWHSLVFRYLASNHYIISN